MRCAFCFAILDIFWLRLLMSLISGWYCVVGGHFRCPCSILFAILAWLLLGWLDFLLSSVELQYIRFFWLLALLFLLLGRLFRSLQCFDVLGPIRYVFCTLHLLSGCSRFRLGFSWLLLVLIVFSAWLPPWLQLGCQRIWRSYYIVRQRILNCVQI